MEKLTLQQLKEMKPETVFDTGTVSDNSTGINMTNSDKLLRWVAVRGDVHVWTIYCHWADNDIEYIKGYGDKVHFENHIKKLVPCDDEAFQMYRY